MFLSRSGSRVVGRALACQMRRTLAAQAAAESTPHRSLDQMDFTFVSPGAAFYKHADVRQVDVPTMSGNMGILPKHVAVLAVLKPGLLTVHEQDGTTAKYFVSSGSVTVNEDSSVQILAEEACAIEDLDSQAARSALSEAQTMMQKASDEVERAEAQIMVEVGEAIVRAAEHGA